MNSFHRLSSVADLDNALSSSWEFSSDASDIKVVWLELHPVNSYTLSFQSINSVPLRA